jgi:nucleoside-diphosphate-sugar epimerase
MKRALITGAAGFVGRHFARRLLDDGWHVTGVDNFAAGLAHKRWAFQPRSWDNFDWHIDDIRHWMRLTPPRYDLIIHCAAIVGGRLTIENSPLRVATDLAIDADFFNWVTKGAKPKVIYFSSSAVYPVAYQGKTKLRLHESLVTFNSRHLEMPDRTYGWAKLTGELLAKYAVENYGLDVVIYRPFSGYGEDQDFAYPFPSIVKRVTDGEDPVTVWGSGVQARDFIHIDDIVEAVLTTMNRLKPGETLNLGTGRATTFNDLAQEVGSCCGRVIQIRNDLAKPEGVFWRVADPTKLKTMYVPKIPIEEGIARAVKHLTRTGDSK